LPRSGRGPDEAAARTPVVLLGGGLRVRVVAAADHPSAYAAAPDRPGIAFADRSATPGAALCTSTLSLSGSSTTSGETRD
jgi:poly-gamma-glutamate synthesis protein (capsule biosynthesis protein)